MSKTPEQVARDAAMEAMAGDSISLVVVSALRSAGWLRDCPWSDEDRIDTLTRERDEARQLIDEYRKVAERYEANTASPEMLRVVDAAKEFRAAVGSTKRLDALFAAINALVASQQPKAQGPRYEVVASSGGWQEGGCVRSIKTQELAFGSWRGICEDDSLAAFHKARCEAECARLNASEAK